MEVDFFECRKMSENDKLPYIPIDLRKKKLKNNKTYTFRHATRRKVIQVTPGIFVTSKSKYGSKGQNPLKIRAKVLLTFRAFPGQIDR